MKTILFPTDFSQSAAPALAWAKMFTHQYNATLTLLHVYLPALPIVPDPSLGGSISPETELAVEEINRKQLEELGDTLREEGLTVQTNWQIGNVDEQILNVAHDVQADLIVTGRRDLTSFFDRITGTYASDVAKKATCPVLIVPDSVATESLQLKKIAYSTQLEEDDRATLRSALTLANEFNASLQLIHINADNQPNVFNNDDMLADLRHEFGESALGIDYVNARTVSDGLTDYLDKHPTDLLVMTTRKRDFLDSLLKPSITGRMLTHSSVPLLVYHA